jgi:hypothetical protein
VEKNANRRENNRAGKKITPGNSQRVVKMKITIESKRGLLVHEITSNEELLVLLDKLNNDVKLLADFSIKEINPVITQDEPQKLATTKKQEREEKLPFDYVSKYVLDHFKPLVSFSVDDVWDGRTDRWECSHRWMLLSKLERMVEKKLLFQNEDDIQGWDSRFWIPLPETKIAKDVSDQFFTIIQEHFVPGEKFRCRDIGKIFDNTPQKIGIELKRLMKKGILDNNGSHQDKIWWIRDQEKEMQEIKGVLKSTRKQEIEAMREGW